MSTEDGGQFSQFESTRNAIATIGREAGPDSTGLLVALMEQNAIHTEGMGRMIREGVELERDKWRERALEAERHLRFVETRIVGLLAPPPASWDPFDRGM